MPNRTDLSQPDEALRQTRAIEEAGDLRQLLTRIADRLTENLPGRAMREVNRLAYARDYSDAEHGYRTPMALAVERALLRQMPRIDTCPITRGEYALLLRARAWARHPGGARRRAPAGGRRGVHRRPPLARTRLAVVVCARIDGNASATRSTPGRAPPRARPAHASVCRAVALLLLIIMLAAPLGAKSAAVVALIAAFVWPATGDGTIWAIPGQLAAAALMSVGG
ncbi:hypothetical protein SCALM49S_04551 [Streptomyces californicus]